MAAAIVGAAAFGLWVDGAATERTNPVPAAPEALQKGRALWQRHCRSCHGETGRGDGPAAKERGPIPDVTTERFQAEWSDGAVFDVVSDGVVEDGTGTVLMPAFARQIPKDDDRWKLVRFVRSLRPTAPRTP